MTYCRTFMISPLLAQLQFERPPQMSSPEFKSKVIKLMERAVHLLEGQQSSSALQERVVNENAKHFESVLNAYVKLPLRNPQELVDLNEALNDTPFAVAMVQSFIFTITLLFP